MRGNHSHSSTSLQALLARIPHFGGSERRRTHIVTIIPGSYDFALHHSTTGATLRVPFCGLPSMIELLGRSWAW